MLTTRCSLCAMSCRTSADPMKPAPPVMRYVATASRKGRKRARSLNVSLRSRQVADLCQVEQVPTVVGLRERCGERTQAIRVDEAHPVRNLFDGADEESLSLLDDRDVVRRVQQRLMRARIEPGNATPQNLDVEAACLEIALVHVGDLELAPRRRVEAARDAHDVVVVVVETDHRVVRSRVGRFLLDVEGTSLGIELHDSVPLGILDVVAEDRRASGIGRGFLNALDESLAEEQIVA